ncbi:hypothetical protein THAOC_30836 [Thalassiosira oceanica]|uniref:50S ribosomal protein L35 n=1 Tax=Thalassiosira oceanica TaxID=159749 RepID=K0RMX1_THAOC|nr:hypothetical protein THAOC_30836 [Thalassiosira oceanica]|mmetsp:Transcript_16185/g.36255  ORF Transcript_16185/g.36255 Transcript_16185/m.36255 type:complete len:112 (+) Transcript_16185:203-538(+)|eukprot:EJK50221.1 hypothetical protein THAOC_30836 [Thalassiosira oceanica]
MFGALLRHAQLMATRRPNFFARATPLPRPWPSLEAPINVACGAHRGKKCLNTNRSASKRFIVRGSGSIKRGKAGRSHNTGHKGQKRLNRLATSAPIRGKKIEQRMRRLIGA